MYPSSSTQFPARRISSASPPGPTAHLPPGPWGRSPCRGPAGWTTARHRSRTGPHRTPWLRCITCAGARGVGGGRDRQGAQLAVAGNSGYGLWPRGGHALPGVRSEGWRGRAWEAACSRVMGRHSLRGRHACQGMQEPGGSRRTPWRGCPRGRRQARATPESAAGGVRARCTHQVGTTGPQSCPISWQAPCVQCGGQRCGVPSAAGVPQLAAPASSSPHLLGGWHKVRVQRVDGVDILPACLQMGQGVYVFICCFAQAAASSWSEPWKCRSLQPAGARTCMPASTAARALRCGGQSPTHNSARQVDSRGTPSAVQSAAWLLAAGGVEHRRY